MEPTLPMLRQRAAAHAAAQQWAAAAACCDAIVAAAPDDAGAWLELSMLRSKLQQHRGAVAATLAALRADPREPALVLALARRLRYCNEVDALLRWLGTFDPVALGMDGAQLAELADVLTTVDAHAQARALAEAAVAAAPDHAPAHYVQGTALMFCGELDAAEHAFERCLALAPAFEHAHWQLASLRTPTAERNHVARLQQQLAATRPGSEAESYLAFGLHQQLHALGRHDAAWDALQRGCRAKRAHVRYDADAWQRTFDAVQALCDAAFVQPAAAHVDGPTPIFIVGMYRSGTTLLERIVGGHSAVSDGGETHAFVEALRRATDRRQREVVDAEMVRRAASIDFAALGAEFMRLSAWRARGRACWTEKLPVNFVNIGFIAKALPHARFLHLRRDPRATCFSNLRTLFSNVCGYTYDMHELAGYWQRYMRLMAHWRAVLPAQLLDVDYEALVDDPHAEARRVFAFLGLPFEAAALAIEKRGGAVSTASSVQVRAGIVRRDAPDWLPYAAQLQPLFAALEGAHAPAVRA